MIRLVKRDKDGKVTAQCIMDIPRKVASVKTVKELNPEFDRIKAEENPDYNVPEFIVKNETEEIDHSSLTASLADGWEENYTDMLAPAPALQPEFDFNTLKTKFVTATSDEKINIMAKLLRLI